MIDRSHWEQDFPRDMNATTYLLDDHVAAGRGDKIAVYSRDQTFTYRQMLDLVNQTANLFDELGLEREDRVAILLHDSPEWIAAFFGALRLGAIAVPLNTRLVTRDYEHFLKDSAAKILVVSSELLPVVRPCLDRLPHLRRILVAGTVDGEGEGHRRNGSPAMISTDNFKTLIQTQSPKRSAEETCCDDAAFWLYTSGTTGLPKAAVHLHHDILCCLDYGVGVLGANDRDVTFATSKLFFAYALGNALFIPFMVGASTVLHPDWPLPQDVFALVQRYQPTLFFSIPTFYSRMLHDPSAPANVFSSVRCLVSAGEALPAEIYRRWQERFGQEILDGIGTTETIYMFLSSRPGQTRPGSTGQPVPGCEVRLLDEDGQPVRPGVEGVLWVKIESCAAAYWNQHQRSKGTFVGEWFRTGDIYQMDEDGYYYNCGRSDDMLKVGGMWVSPLEVEAALLEHELVQEAAVVGAPDQDGLIKPKAYVVLRPGADCTPMIASQLQAFVRSRIAPYKYPRWIECIDQLPRTVTGKVQRYRLREMAMARG